MPSLDRWRSSALTIAQLYRCRWRVELFFKWIKQNLRIKKFYGNSVNALKTQVWIAVSVYVVSVAEGFGTNAARPGLYKNDASLSLWQTSFTQCQGEQGCVESRKPCCISSPMTMGCPRAYATTVND